MSLKVTDLLFYIYATRMLYTSSSDISYHYQRRVQLRRKWTLAQTDVIWRPKIIQENLDSHINDTSESKQDSEEETGKS